MPLQRTSLEKFLAHPIGCYFGGPTYVGWSFSPQFSGGASWGRPTVEDVETMVRGHDWHDAAGHQPPIDVLLDASATEHVSAEVFTTYVRRVVPRVPFFARFIRRQALVVPPGRVGAVFAGF